MNKSHFQVFDGNGGSVKTYNRDGGGSGGDGMDIEKRMDGIERAQVQIGMDMQYLKGRIEDMPTKDWVNTKLLAYAGAVSAIVVVCGTILGYLITSGFSAMTLMIGG